MRFFHLLALFALCSGAALAQLPESPNTSKPVEIYLARDDGAGNAGDAAEIFAPSDIPIHCVVVLTDAQPRTVRMLLVAVMVPGVKTETRVVAAAYTTKDLQDRVYFTGRPEGKW